MENTAQFILGICRGDTAVKAELRSSYFDMIRGFVEVNNKKNNSQIKPEYIYDSILGLINMKFTSIIKNEDWEKKIRKYQFAGLIYYLAKELFKSEFRIRTRKAKGKLRWLTPTVTVIDTEKLTIGEIYYKDFYDVIQTRERELRLVFDVFESNSIDAFKSEYFDLAIDIVNKWKSATNHLNNLELQEYAKDIFWEAVAKLIDLIKSGKYTYEAKISSFLYWPMFNRWAKITKELGIEINEDIYDQIPDDERMYFETNVEKEELKRFITENLQKLNDKEKQVLWMKEAEGYSYQEIKEKLNLDEEINYLKQIKLRAKRSLEIFLREDVRFKDFFFE